MSNLLRKNKLKRLLFSKPVIIIVLILILFVSRATWNVWEKKNITAEKLSNARQELEELQEREGELSLELAALDTPEGVESEIRSTYGLAKEGEHVLVILEEEDDVEGGQSSQTSLWTQIKSLFW